MPQCNRSRRTPNLAGGHSLTAQTRAAAGRLGRDCSIGAHASDRAVTPACDRAARTPATRPECPTDLSAHTPSIPTSSAGRVDCREHRMSARPHYLGLDAGQTTFVGFARQSADDGVKRSCSKMDAAVRILICDAAERHCSYLRTPCARPAAGASLRPGGAASWSLELQGHALDRHAACTLAQCVALHRRPVPLRDSSSRAPASAFVTGELRLHASGAFFPVTAHARRYANLRTRA